MDAAKSANDANLAAKPAHVPDWAVVDFDLYYDAALLHDLHGRVLELTKTTPPVFWTPRNGGAWVIRSHAAVFEASKEPTKFASEFVPMHVVRAKRAALKPGDPHILMPTPIGMDPPIHGAYRAPLLAAFSPKAIAKLKESVAELCVELVDGIAPMGACEFISTVAEPLPVRIFLKMFGLPVVRQEEYRALVNEHALPQPYDPVKVQTRLRKLASIMRDTLIDRRDNPRDDLISMLWRSSIDGRPPSLNEIEDYCVVLFLAGLDTVVNGIGLGVRHLAMTPGLQKQLRDEPELIAGATEEMLRRYAFTAPPRMVAQDIEFEGVTLKKGEIAYLYLPAANLDAAEYPNPAAVDLNRENKTHIAFGVGPHRCLGSHLARMELQTLYSVLLSRLPPFVLDEQRPTEFHGGTVVGPTKLYIRWSS